jgi:diadenosine tetraphosphatase ApaH/serine/threonine PP2A family protein phosphatase
MKIYSHEIGTKIFLSFIDAFDWMPFSAEVDSNILCLHGGISPFLINVHQLKELQRPYHSFTNNLIEDILWSDPRDVDCFEKSDRGLGCFFGEKHLESFLTVNHLDLLVRAHECTSEDGYAYNGKCLTIFSASNYCGKTKNKSSVLIIRSKDEKEVRTFLPLTYFRREDVSFKKFRSVEKSSSLASSITKRTLFLPSGKLNMKDMRRNLSILF